MKTSPVSEKSWSASAETPARSAHGVPPWPAALLAPAGVALFAGLDAALLLLGLPAPVSPDRLPAVHGMLLVFGFVGALVALERGVASRSRLGYAAPVLLGLGGLLLVSPAPLPVGTSSLLGGAIALVGVYVALWRRQRDAAVLVQALGAVLAAGALMMWLGGVAVPVLLPWLVGFIVLTVGGERLELARLTMGPAAGRTLVALSTGLAAGVVASLLWPPVGLPILGLAVLVLVGWLGSHDVARRTIRASGLARFMAVNMLAGYLWLAVAGGTWLIGGPPAGGAAYDVVIHAVFLGFTMSMIMAHAPVILPAVLRRPLPYRPVLWVPLVLLHLSLAVRLWLGDAMGVHLAWQVGGTLNVAALLLFFALAAWSVVTLARRRRRARLEVAGRAA
ncbi:MAG TPA: hypothetical protein VFJ14_04870 [Nocardioidaceae bacterium]|nr:hypothetical protein [Nocardioidaceae bacterium]